jgi:hypothetical protein
LSRYDSDLLLGLLPFAFLYGIGSTASQFESGGTTAKRTRKGSLFVIDYGTSWAYGYTVARDSGSPAKGIAYAKIATY